MKSNLFIQKKFFAAGTTSIHLNAFGYTSLLTEVKMQIVKLLFCVCIHHVVSAQQNRTSLCNAMVIVEPNLMAGMCASNSTFL